MLKDELSPEFVRRGLETRFVGRCIRYFPRLASTMDAAREAALAGAAEGMVVLVGEQTAGRGRLKRVWLSPQGCLACSLVLYPEARYLPGLVMVAALAAAETVKAFVPVAAEIKWPNDVLIRNRKISGIIVETGLRGNCRNYAVVGIGLNVNMNASACPGISAVATSLSEEAGRKLSRAAVLRVLLARFEYWYEALLGGGAVFQSWRARLTTLGKEIQVLAGGVLYEGVAEDVTPEGALLLRLRDGRLMNMPAGDVTIKSSGADESSAG